MYLSVCMHMNTLLYENPCQIAGCPGHELYDMKNGRESREHRGFCFETHLFYELNSLLADKSRPWFFLASL